MKKIREVCINTGNCLKILEENQGILLKLDKIREMLMKFFVFVS